MVLGGQEENYLQIQQRSNLNDTYATIVVGRDTENQVLQYVQTNRVTSSWPPSVPYAHKSK